MDGGGGDRGDGAGGQAIFWHPPSRDAVRIFIPFRISMKADRADRSGPFTNTTRTYLNGFRVCATTR